MFVVSIVVGRTRMNIRFSIVVARFETATGVVLSVPDLMRAVFLRLVREVV